VTDALAVARVDLVRHRRGADLTFLETLGQQARAGHEPERGGAARRRGTGLVQRAHGVEIERARINLADGAEGRLEPKVLDDAALELVHLVGVAAEQRELVELRADGALEAADRIAGDEVVEPGVREQQLLAEHGEALAEGGRLRGHVVRAAGEHHVAVLGGAPGQQVERGHGLELDEFQRTGDLELLDVLREVAAGEAEVDELALGELGKFLQAGLHVVEGDALALPDAVEVHLVAHALIVLDRLGRDGDAEVALGLHHRDPKITLQQNAAVRRPDLPHGRRGVALGEHVGDGVGGGGGRRVVQGRKALVPAPGVANGKACQVSVPVRWSPTSGRAV
jgi:hypothetical protein